MKREFQFTPIFTVTLDSETGEMTGEFDWESSAQGEWDKEKSEHFQTPVNAVVADALDSVPGLDKALWLGRFPEGKFVVIDREGMDYNATVKGSKQEAQSVINQMGSTPPGLRIQQVYSSTVVTPKFA